MTSSATVFGTPPSLELSDATQTQRFSLTQDEHRLGRDRTWADLLLPETGWEAVSGRHARLKREGLYFRILDGDGNGNPSRNGIFMSHTRISTEVDLLLDYPLQFQIGQDPRNLVQVTYQPGSLEGSWSENASVEHSSFNRTSQHSGTNGNVSLDLATVIAWPVNLGREVPPHHAMTYGRSESIALPSPTVSRRHASISDWSLYPALEGDGVNPGGSGRSHSFGCLSTLPPGQGWQSTYDLGGGKRCGQINTDENPPGNCTHYHRCRLPERG